MKRAALVLFALLILSCAQAQGSYFGIRVDVGGTFSPLNVTLPLVGVQLGTPLVDNVELRGSFSTILAANFAEVDIFYTQPLTDMLRGYSGVGVSYGGALLDTYLFYSVHATVGVEQHLGSGIGLFGEVQPVFVLAGPFQSYGVEPFMWKLNAGINFHY